MFGYVTAERTELKVREDRYYQGLYCGLCRSMGRCTGQCSRMALSYDFTFLALVRLSLNETEVRFVPKRCLAHPLTKRPVMLPNEELEYAAAAAALLHERKNADDRSDERGLRRLRSCLLAPFFQHGKRKALKRFPALRVLEERLDRSLERLSAMERDRQKSVNLPAEQFGELLGEVMSFGLEEKKAPIAREIGRSVGQWIYMVDALDDLEQDAEKGRYNPFLLLWDGIPDREEKERIGAALCCQLQRASDALDLMSFSQDPEHIRQHLLENILHFGLPARADRILSDRHACKADKEQENNRKESEK
ncbi:MAG: hypothetical protein IJY42_04230 [Clostridia bacterium]|nr:hypothetical protein [Clostridia bacterium]